MNFKLSNPKKCFLFMLVFCVITNIGSLTFAAEANIESNNVKPEYNLDNICKINSSGFVTINGEKHNLYKVFEDQSEALKNIKNKFPTILNCISLKYGLAPLSNDNWSLYQEKLFDYQNYLSGGESNSELIILKKFFDIYENSDKNKLITNYIKNKSTSDANAMLSDYDVNLSVLLPYTDNTFSKLKDVGLSSVNTMSTSFNINAAISYAEQYAANPNKYKYMYFPGHDCTNFASQILEAGGVSQVYTGSLYSGWWHTCDISFGMSSNHASSDSWQLADVFCRYMGIGYTTSSISAFTHNIARGDFIAADFYPDGDWNHVGFVTSVKSSPTTVGGKTYYDFKVAQHSNDYYEWTSSSNNGWDDIGSDGGTYARVRR